MKTGTSFSVDLKKLEFETETVVTKASKLLDTSNSKRKNALKQHEEIQADVSIPIQKVVRLNGLINPALAPIAKACVKKIGGRYLIDLAAFQRYVENSR